MWHAVGMVAAASSPTLLLVTCASCHKPIELECEALPGFWGYKTHNEFFCPHCGKQNHARSTGKIIAARAL
jgi:predicted RNA-binding Zn-ribbon protein involved in translation (DUF1610 family)